MVGPYSVSPQSEQDSITAYLRAEYPHIPVIEDGLMDDQVYTEPGGTEVAIPTFPDGSVKPFIVLWYSDIKRSARGRSFSDYKLDSHFATVDVVVVTRSGTEGRKLTNDVNDRMIGFRADGGGRLHKGTPLWADSRQMLDDTNRPSRWARTVRYDFGVASRKIVTP